MRILPVSTAGKSPRGRLPTQTPDTATNSPSLQYAKQSSWGGGASQQDITDHILVEVGGGGERAALSDPELLCYMLTLCCALYNSNQFIHIALVHLDRTCIIYC